VFQMVGEATAKLREPKHVWIPGELFAPGANKLTN